MTSHSSRRKGAFIVLGILLIIVITAGAILIPNWNKPLSVSMQLPTRTPTQPAPVDATPTSAATLEATQAALPQVTATQGPVCGGPPVMYVIAIGADNRDDTYLYGLADVIRIARIDFVKAKVTVLTMPRDLWVEIPDLKEKYQEQFGFAKLNQAYLFGGPGMGYYEGPGDGPGLMARTLALNYDLYVDHYVTVNMQTFTKIVDALGGIEIYLDQDWDGRPVDENTEDMGYFTAGQHHMMGAEALRFSRIRKKYSEYARSDNQTLVICAIKDKLTSPSVITGLPGLVQSFIGMVQTDFTPAQISQLLCLLPRLNNDSIQFIRFPDEMMKMGNIFSPAINDTTFVWDIPKEDIRAFVKDFENDRIPPKASGMSCPQSAK